MTRKDYILIAEALRDALPHWSTEEGRKHQAVAIQAHRLSVECVADALARDNARFDRERFLKACGL